MQKWLLLAIIFLVFYGCQQEKKQPALSHQETPAKKSPTLQLKSPTQATATQPDKTLPPAADQQAEPKQKESEKKTTPGPGRRAIASKLKIAFIYIAPVGDAGWSWAHDQGRKKMLEQGAEIIAGADYEPAVPDGPKCIPAIEKYAKAGYHLIYTTSFGYMDGTLALAKKYPDTVFMHCSGHKSYRNMGNYFGRIYQPDYLSGLVAGKMTKNGKIGYVAPHPIPEVIRGINAFTIGVRQANPQAQVFVRWVHSWYNPEKERACAEALMTVNKVDIMAQGQDSPAALLCAQEEGLLGIGYNADMQKFAPQAHLTSPVWNWGTLYIDIARQVKNGTWNNTPIWWGMDKGLVALAPLSEKVPQSVRDLVQRQRQSIIAGSFKVFQGPLYNQKGELIAASGIELSDQDKLEMNYFVAGVVGDIPKPEGLGEH